MVISAPSTTCFVRSGPSQLHRYALSSRSYHHHHRIGDSSYRLVFNRRTHHHPLHHLQPRILPPPLRLNFSQKNNNDDLERMMERLFFGAQAEDDVDDWKQVRQSFQVKQQENDWKGKLKGGWKSFKRIVKRRSKILLLAPLVVIAAIQLTGVATVGLGIVALLLASLTLPVFALFAIIPLAFFFLFGALTTPILPLALVFAPGLIVPFLFVGAFLLFQFLSFTTGPSNFVEFTEVDSSRSQQPSKGSRIPGVIDITASVDDADDDDPGKMEPGRGEDAWRDLNDFDEKLRGPATMRSLDEWTAEQVADAASSAGLGRFRTIILRNRVDGRVAQIIGEEEIMNELGVVTFGDRKRLLLFFEELRSSR